MVGLHRAGPVRRGIRSHRWNRFPLDPLAPLEMMVAAAGSGAGMMRGMTVPRDGIDAAMGHRQMAMMMMVVMDGLQNNNHVQNYQNRKFLFSNGVCVLVFFWFEWGWSWVESWFSYERGEKVPC